MKKYGAISRQVVISFVFMFIVFFTGLLRTSILTRNLSMDEYGVFSMFFVSISFFSVVLELGLSNFLITRLSGASDRRRLQSFFSVLSFITLFLLVFLLAVELSGVLPWFLSVFGVDAYKAEFDIVLIVICLAVIFRIFNAHLSSRQKIGLSSFMAFVKQAAWVYLLIIVAIASGKLSLYQSFVVMGIGVAASVLLFLLHDFSDLVKFISSIKFSRIKRIIRAALRFGLPLLPFLIGDWLIQVNDKWLLKYFTDGATVGVYTLGYSLVAFVMGAASVITETIYPYYCESWNKRQDHNVFGNISVKYLLILILPSLTGLWVLRSAIITMISGQDYLAAANVIPWLILFPLFGSLSVVFYQTMMLRGLTKKIGLVYGVSGFINFLLNIVLIPLLGIIGAAIATTVGYFATFIGTYWFARHDLEIDLDFVKLYRIAASCIVMGVVVYVINPRWILDKIFTMALGGCIYLAGLFVFRVFTDKELAFFKKYIRGIMSKIMS